MKAKKLYIFTILLLVPIITACHTSQKEICKNNTVTRQSEVPLADPFILLHDGIYYAYGTHSADGIEVWCSKDLKHWEIPGGNTSPLLALDKKDTWGDKWFWAPEVYFINHKFYMYYSADTHLCVAVSDSPCGPFKQAEQKPMWDEESIDGSLFIDDDGKAYFFFVRFNDGNNIWVAEMNDDYLTFDMNTLHHCVHVSQKWEEVWPRVNEGPFILKHDQTYYLTYSANSYESQYYGIGCATATNIMGEWEKYADNPILQSPHDLVGVGHHSFFKDKKNKLRIVYHAHFNRSKIHPRLMYIGNARFQRSNGNDRLIIGSDYTVPLLKK